jgi:hypothetical protein
MRRNSPLFVLLAASVSYGATVTYTDQAAFLAAAQTIPNTSTELETFDSGAITAPNLSVQDYSDWGHHNAVPLGNISNISNNGTFNGCVGYNCNDYMYASTVWSFGKPVYAFGATLAYPASEPQAAGIQADGTVFPFQNGFFGFVSDQPFTSLTFRENELNSPPPGGCGACLPATQYYALDNLYIQIDPPGASDAPEPGTFALLTLPLIALGLYRRRR